MEERGFHGFLGNTISEQKLPIFNSMSACSGRKLRNDSFDRTDHSALKNLRNLAGIPAAKKCAIQGLNYRPSTISVAL